jgi:hypothetical protein
MVLMYKNRESQVEGAYELERESCVYVQLEALDFVHNLNPATTTFTSTLILHDHISELGESPRKVQDLPSAPLTVLSTRAARSSKMPT